MTRSLAPKYEELGALYNSHKSKIVVAKVDATANDVPDEIQGFPTIKLYPAGSKKKTAIDYNGSRTVEDLANFIRDNGHHKIDGLAGKKSDDDDDEDVIAKATDGMPQQAMAASETAKGAAAKVAEKATDAVKAAAEAIIDDEGGAADHDEL